MIPISSVSTLLPPQFPMTPNATATGVTPQSPPVAAAAKASSGGDRGTSTDSGARSGNGAFAYQVVASRTARPAMSEPMTASVSVAIKAEDTRQISEDAARRYAIHKMQMAYAQWPAAILTPAGVGPENDFAPIKATGLMPLPTADILINFKTGMTP